MFHITKKMHHAQKKQKVVQLSPYQCGDKCFTRPAIHIWCKKFARE